MTPTRRVAAGVTGKSAAGPSGINIGLNFNWNTIGEPLGSTASFIASATGSGATLNNCGGAVTSSTQACDFVFTYSIGGVPQAGVSPGGVYETWPSGSPNSRLCDINPSNTAPLTLFSCFNQNSFGQIFMASATGLLSGVTMQFTCQNPSGQPPSGLSAVIYQINAGGLSIGSTPLAQVPLDLSSCPTLTGWTGHTFSLADFATIPLNFSGVNVTAGNFYGVFFTGTLAPGTPLPGAVLPPTINETFGTSSISLGGQTSLMFTITNPNMTNATGVAFTDSLPSGLRAANVTKSQCGGTLTVSSNTITLSGATVANGSPCTFAVTVTGTAAGMQTNTTTAVSSTNGGTGSTATANITVNSRSLAATPAPSSLLLLLIGLAVIGWHGRRRSLKLNR